MAIVGRVSAIWRYPVKSMLGEELDRCALTGLGIPGDRGWALRDEAVGEMRGGKKFPLLMQCRARYRAEPQGDTIPPVDLELPNGARVGSDAADVGEQLSALLGKPVTLWPRQPEGDREHYRRREQRGEAGLREALGLEAGEPLPDFSIYPEALLAILGEFTSPLGTYFDAYPLHLITTSWLEALAARNPDARFEAPRFRPNLLIEGAEAGFAELAWCGKRLRIGAAEITCEAPTVRCSMTVQQTGDLPKDPKVLRTIVRESEQNVGAYATVCLPGAVRVGDTLELV